MQPEQENFIRGQLKLQDNIKLAAAELQLSEKINVRQEETEAYAFTAFLADTGGALGLFLGLSVLQIFQWLGTLYSHSVKTAKFLFDSCKHVKSVRLDF